MASLEVAVGLGLDVAVLVGARGVKVAVLAGVTGDTAGRGVGVAVGAGRENMKQASSSRLAASRSTASASLPALDAHWGLLPG